MGGDKKEGGSVEGERDTDSPFVSYNISQTGCHL